MIIKGRVGAVYSDDTAPLSDNIALLFDWTLHAEHRDEFTFGPELRGMLTSWHVTAESYWAEKNIPKGQAFVRLFISKGKGTCCLVGPVQLPALQKTDGIYETEIKLQGVGPLYPKF